MTSHTKSHVHRKNVPQIFNSNSQIEMNLMNVCRVPSNISTFHRNISIAGTHCPRFFSSSLKFLQSFQHEGFYFGNSSPLIAPPHALLLLLFPQNAAAWPSSQATGSASWVAPRDAEERWPEAPGGDGAQGLGTAAIILRKITQRFVLRIVIQRL